MSTQYNTTHNYIVGYPTIDIGSANFEGFLSQNYFEAYHIITFLQELNELEHAMLLIEDDGSSQDL